MDNLSPNQIKQMIELLQNMLPQTQEQPADSGMDKEQDANNIKTKKPRKNKKGSFVNEFENMQEFKLHKEDVEVDKRLKQFPTTARTRRYNAKEVQCRVCGRKDKVHPMFANDGRYKCNNCSRASG